MVASAVVRRVSEGARHKKPWEAASGSSSRGPARSAVNVYKYGAAQVMRAVHAQYAASLFLLHQTSVLTFTCLVCCAVLCVQLWHPPCLPSVA